MGERLSCKNSLLIYNSKKEGGMGHAQGPPQSKLNARLLAGRFFSPIVGYPFQLFVRFFQLSVKVPKLRQLYCRIE